MSFFMSPSEHTRTSGGSAVSYATEVRRLPPALPRAPGVRDFSPWGGAAGGRPRGRRGCATSTVPSGAPTTAAISSYGQAVDVAQDERGDHLRAVAFEGLEGLEEVEAGAGDDAGGARVRPAPSSPGCALPGRYASACGTSNGPSSPRPSGPRWRSCSGRSTCRSWWRCSAGPPGPRPRRPRSTAARCGRSAVHAGRPAAAGRPSRVCRPPGPARPGFRGRRSGWCSRSSAPSLSIGPRPGTLGTP